MNKRDLTVVASQYFHYLSYSLRKQASRLDTASLIISIDVDVGDPQLGVKNAGSNDRNVNDTLSEYTVGKMEMQVIPLLLEAFNKYDFPATFALRGQLTEIEYSLITQILNSSTQHEIAAHGYSHRVFTALSEAEAQTELAMIKAGMMKYHISPKSFVYPKNQIAHLNLLEKEGYLAFRGLGSFSKDGMYVKKCGRLFDVHPSLFSEFYESYISKKILSLAIKYRAPLHIWFHPWNLGAPEEAAKRITKGLLPLIKYAKEKKNQGLINFDTMYSIARKYSTGDV
jgi:peptidoglycan/xylan/chitin deacetylase (PgdA/CDA1 family)